MKYMAILLIFAAVPLMAGSCPNERCERKEKSAKQRYNPLKRYYPYCSIYHDSSVRDPVQPEGEPSWPSRDDTFSDELSR